MGKGKSRREKFRPYQVIKHEYVQVSNPFESIPTEDRRAMFKEIGSAARARFEEDYPKTADWFVSYDALHLLAFCAFYYLSTPAGIDPEAIHGKLDFASLDLELLQAFSLTKPRAASTKLLGENGAALKKHMQDIGEALKFSALDFPDDLSEAEFRKRMVIRQMQEWTFAVRHWAYRDQMLAHLKELFSGPAASLIADEFKGISIPRLIDAMDRISQKIEDRMNEYLNQMRALVHATNFDETVDHYRRACPKSPLTIEYLREALSTEYEGHLGKLKTSLVAGADRWLNDFYVVTLDDLGEAYGENAPTGALLAVLRRWSLQFGELSNATPMHFLYGNPVLTRPLIQISDDSFFWALCGIYGHNVPTMLDLLIPEAQRGAYAKVRANYLETRVAEAFRAKFPNAKVYRGSKFRERPDDPKEYENDILVVVDTTAIIVECKSGRVDPPARRGAPDRLADTFDDLIAAASTQALRFANFLRANPRRHTFATKSAVTNNVNATSILRFIPLSVTYESLGYVGANLKELALGGFIDAADASVPSMCFTDLEVVWISSILRRNAFTTSRAASR